LIILYLNQVSYLRSQYEDENFEISSPETKQTKESKLKVDDSILSRSKRYTSTSFVIGAHAVGYQKVLGKQKSPYSHTVMRGLNIK